MKDMTIAAENTHIHTPMKMAQHIAITMNMDMKDMSTIMTMVIITITMKKRFM
jgi:hypothetical protein